MKKKILNLAIVVILASMLILLTGCGTTNTPENKNNNQNEQTSENGENERNENSAIEVSEVYATSEKYAVVLGTDSNYYIIDNTGKMQGQLNVGTLSSSNGNYKVKITNEGNVLINSSGETNGSKIYDKTGKVIFEKTASEYYNELTDYNYTLKTTKTSDFETGNKLTTELVDLTGKVIKSVSEKAKYYYLGGHIWLISEDGYKLYNDSTDKTVEYSNGSDIAFNRNSMNLNKSEEKSYKLSDGGVYYNKSIIVLGDLKIIDKESENVNFSDIQVIDNKYYYNKEDKSIYKWDGTKVKEITSGNGLNNIENINGKYYVKSGTGYYYTMDENFEQTSEPFKIESEKSLRTLSMAKDSIIVENNVSFSKGQYSGTWDHVYVYDYNGNMKQDLGEGWDATTDASSDFIYRVKRMKDKSLSERTGTVSTTNVGGQLHDEFINKNTGESLKIYK